MKAKQIEAAANRIRSEKASDISGDRGIEAAKFAGQAENIKLLADMKKIGLAQEYADLQANLAAEEAAEMKSFDQQMALYARDSKEYAKLQQEKALASQKFANDQIKLQAQQVSAQASSDNKMAADWKSMTSSMQSGFTSAITGMVMGTKSFGSAALGIITSMVSSVIGKFVEMGIEYIGVQLGMLPATKATALTQITASAGEAFSAAFASICAIPIVGPFLAPGVAAASGAAALGGGTALAAFAVGTPNVPMDMMANIHKGEAIVPAKQAQKWRDGDLGMGKNGGDTHFHVTAMDSRDVKKFFNQHGATIASALQNGIRGGSRPLGR